MDGGRPRAFRQLVRDTVDHRPRVDNSDKFTDCRPGSPGQAQPVQR